MAGQDELIRIVVETLLKNEQNLAKLRKDIEGVTDAGDKASGKKGGGGLTGLYEKFDQVKGKALAAGAILVGFTKTLLGLYNAAKEGAGIEQVNNSFETMRQRVGGNLLLMEQMRKAVGYTVSDYDLMNSTLSVTVGMGQDLEAEFVRLTPELMRIAKAAHDLKPELGETGFLFESMAVGIKRNSAMRIDNANVIVSASKAYEKYAVSVGKSADQLTVEEQKLALLYETVSQGQNLLVQAGDLTENNVDAFARWEAATENLGNSLKTKLVPSATTVVETMTLMLTWGERIDEQVRVAHGNVLTTAESYEEYSARMEEAGRVAGRLTISQENLNKVRKSGAPGAAAYADAVVVLTEEEWKEYRATGALAEEHRELAAQIDLARQETMEMVEATKVGMMSQEEFKEQMAQLSYVIQGQYGQSVDNFRERQGALVAKTDELGNEIAELEGRAYLTERQKEQLDTLYTDLDEVEAQLDAEAQAFSRNTAEIIYNIAQRQILSAAEQGLLVDMNNSGSAYDEASQALTMMAQNLGLVDDETANMMNQVLGATEGFISGTTTVSEFSTEMGGLHENLVSTNDITGQFNDELNRTDEMAEIAGENLQVLGKGFTEFGEMVSPQASQVAGLRNDLENMPDYVESTVKVTIIYEGTGEGGVGGGIPVEPRADGGDVASGKPYLVGERGPELFVPNQNGYIVPNGGNTYQFHNSFNYGGSNLTESEIIRTISRQRMLYA